MIRPSPNEFERLKNEEFLKRRILRLKEVRECSKVNASRLRYLYKEQKTKVIHKIAENIQEQINLEDDKTLTNLKLKYEKQRNAMGVAHNNASDWIDPAIHMQEKSETNQTVAQERHGVALNQLRIDKEDKDFVKNARLDALNLAMVIEKERAVAIASLPPPLPPLYSQDVLKDSNDMTPRVRVCDKNKYSVIESFETRSYNVERVNDDTHRYNAMDAGEMHQEHMSRLDTNLHMESEEQAIKAQLRGHHAIKKQTVQKDYGELITNLEHISKGEMAKRQREYHKNELVGPNSAGHLGLGHMAAMTGYKERCRERAVESAVMESLKDITNKTSSQQQVTLVGDSATRGETKLSKLYDIIKRQKENVSFMNREGDDAPNMMKDQETVSRVRELSLSSAICSEEDDDDTETVVLSNDDIPNDTLEKAVTATIKSKSVLEKTTCEKERNTIERKIQQIDLRLERIKETDVDHEDSSRRDSTRAASSEPGCFNMVKCPRTLARGGSNESSVALSDESACSDSLNIIREFQRQALRKLNGQPVTKVNSTHLWAMERQLSDLSLESISITERSWINNLAGSADTPREDISELSESYSLVTDWVRTQPSQIIDRIPDWVTQRGPDQQFMPDLNTSFMDSILNIRSETGLSKDDTLSSCSTVLTHSSVIRRTKQSSITEVSNVGSMLDIQNPRVYDQSQYVTDWSDQFENSRSCSARIHTPTQLPKDPNTGDPHRQEPEEDLIDFQSTEDVSVIKDPVDEEENSYLRALNELIIIAGTSKHSSLSDDRPLDGESRVQSMDQSDFQKIESSESHKHSEEAVTNDFDSCTVDKGLISDYEGFLRGLINKPLMSPTILDNVSMELISGGDESQKRYSSVTMLNEENLGASNGPSIHSDIQDTPPNSDDRKDASYFTSTTKEDQMDEILKDLSLSSIQSQHISPAYTPLMPSSLLAPDLLSQGSLKQLSLYSSDSDGTVVSNNEMKQLSSMSSDEFSMESEGKVQFNKKKMKKLLSSTMKPDRQNVRTMSPDVSSISTISAEACKQLKQKIMEEYFEKNKDHIMSILSGTKSSDLSLKPLESTDDSTPRNPDSGKPSSRLTMDNSELNTARLTNEDFFMTPRTDNNWTDYSPRDEWSTPHTNLRTLSDYVSSEDGAEKVLGEDAYKGVGDQVDLDETLKNYEDERETMSSCGSIDLINFGSLMDIGQYQEFDNNSTSPVHLPLSNHSPSTSCSQKMREDYVPSEESTSDGNSSSFKVLRSYHSSSDSTSTPLGKQDIHELEAHFPSHIQSVNDNSVDMKSDPDTSSLSLASFLKNESMCYQLAESGESPLKDETPQCSRGKDRSIDNSDEMKNQLAQWKKERLTRINQNPPVPSIKNSNVTRTASIRKQDEVEKRSRNIKLYNNLEEVQKMKQMKEAEQRKMDNQIKKKEYAEKLRRLKKQRTEASKH